MPRVDLQISEKILWLASKPKRVKIAVGGRGSGKSTGIADLMLSFLDRGERVLATREFQNSIDDSVHELLKVEIDRLGLEGFDVQSSTIRSASGGSVIYKGLARNITSVKSLAGVHRLWIEEGESISKSSLKVLTPSIRSVAGSEGHPPEIWISMNRASSAGAVAEKYLRRADAELRKTGYYEDDLMMVVEVNWRDNPWFPPELDQERQDDLENLSRAEYDHIWEGEYNEAVDDGIVKPEWFDAAIDAHKRLGFEAQGIRSVGFDPADRGQDDKGLVMRHGSVVTHLEKWKEGDVTDAIDRAFRRADDERADFLVYDGVGVGTAVKTELRHRDPALKIEYHGFIASEGVDDPELLYRDDRPNKQVFRNKRAQYYWKIRDRFEATYRAVEKGVYTDPDAMISISSDCENIRALKSEICRVQRKRGQNTWVQIESKEEMKTREIPSPALADSLVYAFANPPPDKWGKLPDLDANWIV